MPWHDVFQIAFRSVGQARLRFTLTCLGVLIAIATLVAMVSFGAGLREQTVDNFEVREVFTSFQILGSGRAQTLRDYREEESSKPNRTERPSLNESLVERVSQLAGVVSVQEDIRFPARLERNGKSYLTRIRGAGPHVAPLSPYSKITQGRFLTGTRGREIVLTGRVARRLGFDPPETSLGQTIDVLTDRLLRVESEDDLPFETVRIPFDVVGVLPRLLLTQRNPFYRGVVIPLDEARPLWEQSLSGRSALTAVISQKQGRGREFDSVDVRVKDLLSLENVRKEVESWGLTTFAIADEMKRIQEAFMILEVILSVLGMIALVVASLGIANVLVMSVLERRKVIGIMKAIGGTDADVRRIFLVEASLTGLLGGLLGLLAGWGLTRIASIFIIRYFARNGILEVPELFAYPVWLLAGAVLFAVLFSLLSGVLPANRAARVDPVEALRQG